jgi:hypothetical protein
VAGGASGTAECLALAERGIVTGDVFFATWAGADSQFGHGVSPDDFLGRASSNALASVVVDQCDRFISA